MTNEERYAQVICRLYARFAFMNSESKVSVSKFCNAIRGELKEVEVEVALPIELEGDQYFASANVLFVDEGAEERSLQVVALVEEV